jgi:hypothetical protein
VVCGGGEEGGNHCVCVARGSFGGLCYTAGGTGVVYFWTDVYLPVALLLPSIGRDGSEYFVKGRPGGGHDGLLERRLADASHHQLPRGVAHPH